MAELRNIQKSLMSGEKEKAELMLSLAKLKDDLTRLQLSESSPDVSTLSLPSEKLSTASQTDLSGEVRVASTALILHQLSRIIWKVHCVFVCLDGANGYSFGRDGSHETPVR